MLTAPNIALKAAVEAGETTGFKDGGMSAHGSEAVNSWGLSETSRPQILCIWSHHETPEEN
jgi:hypothetical protein